MLIVVVMRAIRKTRLETVTLTPTLPGIGSEVRVCGGQGQLVSECHLEPLPIERE
jgi:hypothetical protein